MGQRFPAVTSRELIRVLNKIGFRLVRQAGTSHAVFRRESDGRRTVVPVHPGAVLKRKTLKAVLQDAGLSVDQLRDIL